ANRGEIAIRAFRAATELGLRTIAVHAREDRDSLHRIKADEAYEIGEPGHPVRAYLDGDAIVATALEVGADAVYPGYGFLSESAAFSRAVANAGLTFVGPPAEVLEVTGSKTHARDVAERAGIPVLAASPLLTSPAEAVAHAERIGYPVFVKAAAGGGGRGMRRVERPEDLAAAVETAMREAEGAFGDPSVFLEQAMTRPRHIEVQILADARGEVVHLFERDCSLQRRHQKVLELAPAPNLPAELREKLCAYAVEFARAVDYRNVGTVEFLVERATEPEARAVFIEMNPRIQVEHTVTEEVTSIDLVASQLRIASGATLADLGLSQDTISTRGFALQARITTEDPEHGFRPDTGRISAYRSPGGAGIRLDAGSAYVGGEISPFFDSMLVKLTTRGADLDTAIRRARRALAEFRVRGVRTNMRFLQAMLAEPALHAGELSTSFIDEHPHLLNAAAGTNRTQRLATFLAERTVNREFGPPPGSPQPATKLPAIDETAVPPPGSRDRLRELGPDGFARWLRETDEILVTDTTLRDAHQSLFATRMRTYDMLQAAPHLAHGLPQLLSLEAWGGATYDVALRFLHEDPWGRLEQLREAIPNICLQMLLRGRNLLGYTAYSERAVRAFVEEAAAAGMDIFRIFDALNDVDQMRTAIAATRDAGALAEGTLCYSGDLSNPDERTFTLDHYLGVAEGVLDAGAHILCIKDMAGLLRAPAAHTLVTALRERFDAPVHLHTHDTAGGQLATYLAAIDAGVDAIDGAAAPMSGMTSQPSLAAIVAATDHGSRRTGLELQNLWAMEPYWEAVRKLYAPFESGMKSPTGTVYRHGIPGGQLSNLRSQAGALGLGDRVEEIEEAYARCDELLGRIIKVTPTSKVVGDLALYVVSAGVDVDELERDPSRFDLPDSVIGFLRGELGTPHGGWPEPFRTKVLEAKASSKPVAGPPVEDLPDEPGPVRRRALDRLQFPGPTKDFEHAYELYWDVSRLPTDAFWHGLGQDHEVEVELRRGTKVYFSLQAVGEPDEGGFRTVLLHVNGQSRPIEIRDHAIHSEVASVEKADAANPAHVAAPLSGVITWAVDVGAEVVAGDPVAMIEAMKMESTISAPHTGRVARVATGAGTKVEPGDLVCEVTPAG
ncbi:MAG: pyruvate carboxylase, partial [Nitriliruptoraceae bacterium]